MTEDNAKDDAKSSDDVPTEEEALKEDMEEFVLALNRFVHLVEGMDWPDNFQLAKDQQHCFHVFRTLGQRMRQRRENLSVGDMTMCVFKHEQRGCSAFLPKQIQSIHRR